MKNVRLLSITLLLIVALGVSACSAALPGAQAIGSLLPLRNSAAQAAATPAPSAVAAGSAKDIVAGDLQGTLQQIYETVNPSVVNVSVTEEVQGSLQNMPNFPGMPGGRNNNANPQQPRTTQALGSGFVWDRDGDIVTNNHVVDGATDITVTFYDGTVLPAKLVGQDPDSDLAVIKVTGKMPSAAVPITVADSTEVKVGQFGVAIGNPFGLEGTMTFGIVSAVGRTLPTTSQSSSSGTLNYTIPDIIQTDAPVNPGNSGGVLLDLTGRLIGVPAAIESQTGTSSGIGFAIPSAIVQMVVPELIQSGKYEHPYIGISGKSLSSDLAQAMDLADTQRGALVIDVTKGSPAEEAGLLGSTKQATVNGDTVRVGGDVITAIDGQPVKRFEDLTTYLARSGRVGQTVKLTVLRDGKETTVSLTLAARPSQQTQVVEQQQQPRQQQPRQQQPTPTAPATTAGTAWLGVSGLDLTSELAQAMDLSADQTGALIASVTSGSPADKAGLQGSFKSYTTTAGEDVMIGGDVVVEANGKTIDTMSTLASLIRSMKPGDKLALTILRGGEQQKLTVTLATRPATTR